MLIHGSNPHFTGRETEAMRLETVMDGVSEFIHLTQGRWKIASKGLWDPSAHIALKKGSLEYNVNSRELKTIDSAASTCRGEEAANADCIWNRIYITSESKLCSAAGLAVTRPGLRLPWASRELPPARSNVSAHTGPPRLPQACCVVTYWVVWIHELDRVRAAMRSGGFWAGRQWGCRVVCCRGWYRQASLLGLQTTLTLTTAPNVPLRLPALGSNWHQILSGNRTGVIG